MGMQKKHGKGRLDKWYKLAKEKGYRARAAFKLIQINRKYGFLEKSKVLLDLCAAPGSWCQVAAETMPTSSLIVGVDLSPIKPIPRTTTFQSDITTDKCRATIRQHLKTWKADTVLHDGAPNVGTAWVQDAFSQAELVLQSLKLTTEFLIEGGTFVTKVFRSKDYNALLWVFNQLFNKVEATKPPSSRNVSAEIFVVCRGFKAPKTLDPRFLDPRSVFAELSDPTPNNEARVYNPEKKKRKREGYEEGDYVQFRSATASEFVQTNDPISMLGTLNRIVFSQEGNSDITLVALERLPETTCEIKRCCDDLKVLGRKDFKLLLKWRLKAREVFGMATTKPMKVDESEIVETTPMDEELQIREDIERLNDLETSKRRRERRRGNEKKQKEMVRMQLHMTTPTDIGLEQERPNSEGSMFRLQAVTKAGAIESFSRGGMAVQLRAQHQIENDEADQNSDEEEDALDAELDRLFSQYQSRKFESDAKYRARKALKEHDDGEWRGCSDDDRDSEEFGKDDDSESVSEDDMEQEHGSPNPLLVKNYAKPEDGGLTHKAASFFEQNIFKDIGVTQAYEDHDSAVDMGTDESRAGEGAAGAGSPKIGRARMAADVLSSDDCQAMLPVQRLEISELAREKSEAQKADEHEMRGTSYETAKLDRSEWDAHGESRKAGRLDIEIITAEAMTLAQEIATGHKNAHNMADDGFNKYTFRDSDGLPDWFLDDEVKHSRPHRPISAAGAAAIKEKQRALNARPIKKVREAKERKRFKAGQRLEKLRKKSALVAEDETISEKDKSQSIAKLMKKAAKKKPKQQVKVVVARGGNRGISGRPKGVKGKYKIVDARLKKDVRAEKRLARNQRH